mmetsp:Transcript_39499/g.90930  ORF Transcript_39499/g.90930 Transcript_39499/m.90930 type:complete len:501 (-) Transcript_39499:470-1972(-)
MSANCGPLPTADPQKREGKVILKDALVERLKSRMVRSIPNMTNDQACQTLAEIIPLGGTQVIHLGQQISALTNMTESEAEKAILAKMLEEEDIHENTHYIGTIEVLKKNASKPKYSSKNRRITVTTRGMFVITGLIFEGTPAMRPFLDLVGIAVDESNKIHDEMKTQWRALQLEQDERKAQVKENNRAFAEIGGISEESANSMLVSTYRDAYTTHYFMGDNSRVAMVNVGIAPPPKSAKIHKELSVHGNKAEQFRISLLQESVKARKSEVDAEDSPEAKRLAMKKIVTESEAELARDNFGRIPGANKLQQQAAYLRRAPANLLAVGAASPAILGGEPAPAPAPGNHSAGGAPALTAGTPVVLGPGVPGANAPATPVGARKTTRKRGRDRSGKGKQKANEYDFDSDDEEMTLDDAPPAQHEAGLVYGANAADITADNMAIHIAADNMPIHTSARDRVRASERAHGYGVEQGSMSWASARRPGLDRPMRSTRLPGGLNHTTI